MEGRINFTVQWLLRKAVVRVPRLTAAIQVLAEYNPAPRSRSLEKAPLEIWFPVALQHWAQCFDGLSGNFITSDSSPKFWSEFAYFYLPLQFLSAPYFTPGFS